MSNSFHVLSFSHLYFFYHSVELFSSLFLLFSIFLSVLFFSYHFSDQTKGLEANRHRVKVVNKADSSGPAAMFLVVLEGMVYTVGAIFAAAALYLGTYSYLRRRQYSTIDSRSQNNNFISGLCPSIFLFKFFSFLTFFSTCFRNALVQGPKCAIHECF